MDALPLEILHHICSFLPRNSLCPFRLVCSTFSDMGARFLFRQLTFYLHPNDLHTLRQIAKRYPIYVRSLVYMSKTLVSGFTTYEEGGELHLQTGRNSRFSPDIGYVRYVEAANAHRNCINNNDDYILLGEILASLPHLQSITVSGDGYFFKRQRRDYASPFDDLLDLLSGEETPRGARQLGAVLSALPMAVASLETFHAGKIGWSVIEQNLDVLRTPPQSLHRLKHLELAFDTGSDNTEWPAWGFDSHACKATLQSGVLREFLRGLPDLEVLSLDFTYTHRDGTYAASVDDLIPLDHTWKHLRSLALREIEGGQQDFSSVLERHKDTPRELCLSDVKLSTTSLPTLLDQIREDLKLDFICVCGKTLGLVDDRGQSIWSIPRPGDDALWHLLNAYCCIGGGLPTETKCPLLEDRELGWDDLEDDADYVRYEASFSISAANL